EIGALKDRRESCQNPLWHDKWCGADQEYNDRRRKYLLARPKPPQAEEYRNSDGYQCPARSGEQYEIKAIQKKPSSDDATNHKLRCTDNNQQKAGQNQNQLRRIIVRVTHRCACQLKPSSNLTGKETPGNYIDNRRPSEN